MITPPTAPDGLWYWEDINPGDTMDLGKSTMTRDELLAFGRTYDPQPHHVDEEAAANSMFGKLFSSGWHSCCILMRQYVDVMLNKTASLGAGGVEEVRFMKPVFIGDVLSIYADITRVGNTSITVFVEVYAQRNPENIETVKVTEATLTYVAVNTDRRPRSVPPENPH